MKILSLRLKNLNALHGEWKIDFTEKPFLERGLFVISGVAGAGKTTLLDAICMALYHKQFPSTQSKSSLEKLMSYGATDCLAEVEFRVDATHYRAFWSQRRSRYKVDGKLQEPQVELFDLTHGMLLETKLKAKLQHIQAITGMSFELFIKTTLLDQKGFSQFLKASSQDKPKILEQLTGTEVYQVVSQRMFQYFEETKQLLTHEKKSFDNMRVLSQESLYKFEQQQKYLADQIKKMKIERTDSEHQLLWWQNFQKTLVDYDAAYKAYEKACYFEKDAEQALKGLDLESKAKRIYPVYATYVKYNERLHEATSRNNQLQEAMVKIEGRQQSLNLLWQHDQNLVQDLTEKHAAAQPSVMSPQAASVIESQLHQAKKNEILLIHRLAQLRKTKPHEIAINQEYDLLKLKMFIKECLDVQKSLKETKLHCHDASRAMHHVQEAMDKDQKQFLFMQKHFSAMERHQYQLLNKIEQVKLGLEYTNFEEYQLHKERFAKLYQASWARSQLAALASAWNLGQQTFAKTSAKLASLQKEKPKLQASYRQLVKQHQKLKEKLKKLLKTKYKTIQTTKVTEEINSFDKESDRLFVALESVVISKSALATEVETLDQQNKSWRDQERAMKETWRHLKKKAGLARQMKLHETKLWLHELEKQQILQEKLQEQLSSYERHCQVISGLENEYFENQREVQKNAKAMIALEQQLRERRAAVNLATKQLKEQNHAQSQLIFSAAKSLNGSHGLNPTLSNLDEVIEQLQAQYEGLQAVQNAASQYELELCDSELELAETQQNISLLQAQLMESPSQSHSESDMTNQANESQHDLENEKALQKAQIKLQDREQAYASLQESLLDYKQQVAVCVQNLAVFQAQQQQALHDWQQALASSSFNSEDQYLACVPKIDEAVVCKKQKEEAHWQCQKTYEILQSCKNKWESMKAQPIYDDLKASSLTQMQQKQKNLNEQIENLEHELCSIEEQLKQDSDLRRLSQEKIERVRELEKEFEDLDYLTYLMGSQKGEKLRRFAQGLTLDALIHSANQSLTLFDNRYQIERLDGSSQNLVLDLQIIDQWQMTDPKPIDEASVEAQFLVSMVLALSLTELLSDKSPTQSLFLETDFEGFEPASIEVVVDALSQLHRKSKLIGLICNQEAMQEKIGTQIRVIKQSGLGVSRLESHFRM